MQQVGGSAGHRRHAQDRNGVGTAVWPLILKVVEHSLRREIGERGRPRIRRHLLQTPGQRQRFSDDAVEHRPANPSLTRCFERDAKLSGNFALSRLRGVQSACGEEQMLDGCFADPGAESRARFPQGQGPGRSAR